MRTLALLLSLAVLPTLTVMADHHGPTLTPQDSGTLNRLQAVSAVNPRVVWVSGLGGTYALTTDGGKTWQPGVVPGAETLQFRDVEGVNARVAYLMSAGPGADSRVYKTEDGGATWTLQFQNENPAAFYDCFAFWTQKRGITFSDAVDGRFPVIRTTDGETWQDIGDFLPPAQVGEAGFAASGTCVTAQGGKRAWIGTGAATLARILATVDGGVTWELTAWPPFPGAIYGLSYVRGLGTTTVVITGPSGTAWSPDEGDTWEIGDRTLNTGE